MSNELLPIKQLIKDICYEYNISEYDRSTLEIAINELWNTRQSVREKCKPNMYGTVFVQAIAQVAECNCGEPLSEGYTYCPSCSSEIDWPE